MDTGGTPNGVKLSGVISGQDGRNEIALADTSDLWNVPPPRGQCQSTEGEPVYVRSGTIAAQAPTDCALMDRERSAAGGE